MPVEWTSGHVWRCPSLRWPAQDHLQHGLDDFVAVDPDDELDAAEHTTFEDVVKSLADDFWHYGAAAAWFGQCLCNTY